MVQVLMPRRKKIPGEGLTSAPSTPTREDVSDILEEVGARPDDNGELIASEDAVREIGAMDPESVRENRRVEEVVAKKRANIKDVSFGINEPIALYDGLLKLWHVNTIDISVRRLTGSPVQHMIISRPQSGAALYEALRGIHGQYEEAEYEVKFHDSARKQWRGQGRIVMPDTRSQQGSPMNPFNPYGAPPGYPGYPTGYPPAAPPPGYQQQPAPSPQPASQPVAVPQPQPPVIMQPPDVSSMLTQLQQAFEFFKSMQQPPVAVPVPPVPPQPPPFYPPPMIAPAGIGMGELQQMLEFFRSMQQPVAGAQPPTSPPVPQPASPPPNPMTMMGMPPMQPPPGTMWVPGIGFVPIERLMEAVNPTPVPPRRPRPSRFAEPYYPHDDRDDRDERHPRPFYPREPEPPPPPPPPRTVEEQFRESLGVLRTAVRISSELGELTGQRHAPQQQEAYEPADGDDSPVSIIQAGPAKLVINKKDGSLRRWETGWANMGDVLKWMGEQREAIQQHAAQRAVRQQQLPEGFVELTPGYRPPAGYGVVPLDQPVPAPQTRLPPSPAHIPPPINTVPSPPQPPPNPRTWAAPTIEQEEENDAPYDQR